MSEPAGSGLFRQTSLTGRLVRTYLLLSALTVLLVAAAAYEGGKEALRVQALARLETVAAQKENYLNLWVEDRKRDLALLTADLTLNGHLPSTLPPLESDPAALPEYARLSAFFTAAVEARPDISELLFLSPTGGRVLASSRPGGVGRFRTTYNFYLKGREGIALQSAYPSPDSLRPVMTVSMPVRGAKGELLGVLAEHLNLERLDAVIRDRAGLGETGETYLVDSFHTFVSAEIIGRNGGRNLHTPGIDRALSGSSGKGAYDNYAGVPVIGVYRWLPDYRMALLAEMSQAEAFDPARRLAGRIIAVGALAALALALGMRMLSRRLARPVLEVTRAAQAVADGDLSARAPVLTEDELGSLARAFNKMAEDIQTLYAQLNLQIMERTAILQHSHDGIAVADLKGDIHYVSPGMERLFGMKAHEITDIREWMAKTIPGDAERAAMLETWFRDAENPDPPERVVHFRDAGGESRWARLRMAHMPDGRLVLNAQDITAMKVSEARVRHMALHDPLTGLPNRQLFVDRLAQALKHSRRTGLPMALLYVDLDRFKAMNDTHGHQFGDAVLREAAKRLTACVRESDTVARIGGDEFVVVLGDLSDPANAAAVAAKIREALLAPDLPEGLYLAGASIGIAVSPRDGRDQDSLLSAADRAMYVVKRRGGNGYSFASAPAED